MNYPVHRRASIYIVVLATTALVVTMSLLGLELARRDMFSGAVIRDSVDARLAAESGIDYAMAYMHQNNWRGSVGDGIIAKAVPLGGAAFSARLTDRSGDITIPSFDVISIAAVGNSGNSTVRVEARAQAAAVIPEHFDNVLCAQSSIKFESCTVVGTGTIRTGGGALATLASITQPVNVGTTALGVTYNGGTSVSSGALSTFDLASVLAHYRGIGTPVSLAQLSAGQIANQVVSQDVTPWGVTNAYGVYVIDCQGRAIKVKDSRIIATLVFINASAGVEVSKSVQWVPGLSTYPAIICDGSLALLPDAADLSEPTIKVNFNPVGAAGTDRIGPTDIDKLDVYTSGIKGLVLGKDLTLGNALRLNGVAVSTSGATVQNSVRLQYDATIKSTPPPGCTFVGEMYLLEGSMKRTLN